MKSLRQHLCGLLLAALLFSVAACRAACPIEKEWRLDRELKRWFSDWKLGWFEQGHVIAWKAEVDQCPLYVEECLAIIQREKGWILVKLFRHPKENVRGWQLAIVYDSPQTPYLFFNQKPTKRELISFCKSSWWSFEPTSGYRLVRSGICEETLQTLFPNTTPGELKDVHPFQEHR